MQFSILGTGAIGTALASQFVASKVAVSIANTRRPASPGNQDEDWGTLVTQVTSAEALLAEVVILAIPFDSVSVAVKGVTWNRRVVVDATNAIDMPGFTPRNLGGRLSSQIVAEAVPGAHVVKAFNTMFASVLSTEQRILGGRRVLFVSGDEASSRTTVAELIERLGFAAVDLGGISEGGRAQQFGGGLAGKEFVQI